MKPHRVKRTICTTTGKVRYRSYWDARHASNQLRHESEGDHGSPYRCEHCRGWHLGRSSG